ncbi:DUF2784 domain-containing protein [Thiocapsa marina]|uniref:DUF2784 domain-containing protein n=1 Tax=Thiocapsa marina 5811 TaxID=768671 RepID=F9UFY6_9GAMM|nr:DUF2784 domain-containing protein [Thiocapsa marina]EGV17010.1 hypothetical protein ThimaDRAFT_3839 [Thiocapsa marina 5811]
MNPGLVADGLVLVHAFFIVFVALGGLLVLRWPSLAYLHLPCLLWGIAIELGGFICPLTPLEIQWRLAAGEGSYTGGFIDHYVMPAIYPAGLTRGIQILLGLALLIGNGLLYGYLLHKHSRRSIRRP